MNYLFNYVNFKIDALINGEVKCIDYVDAGDICMTNYASVGAMSNAINEINVLNNSISIAEKNVFIEKVRTYIRVIKSVLLSMNERLEITIDDEKREDSYSLAHIANGTSYNNGQNQCPIYLQNGNNIARYTYRKENKPLYNYFNMDVANAASGIEKSGYKNVKVIDRVTVAGNSYLSNVDMSLQGVGSGAGFIELNNGKYIIDSSLNESPAY